MSTAAAPPAGRAELDLPSTFSSFIHASSPHRLCLADRRAIRLRRPIKQHGGSLRSRRRGHRVAPIALELTKTAKKPKDYCRDVKSAREEIRNFAAEVDALRTVLLQLEGFDMMDCPSSSRSLQRCLDLCSNANSTLSSVVSELQQGQRLQGRRTHLAFPPKKDRMKQLTDRVAGAQRSLVLACNVYLMWQTSAQQQMVSDVFAVFQAHANEHSRSFEDLLSGTSAIRQSLLALENDKSIALRGARKNGIDVSRSRRMAARGLNEIAARSWQACLFLATSGWTNSLRSYRTISASHPTYIAVLNGDIVALQRLICAGEASLYDRSLNGNSLISVMHQTPVTKRPATDYCIR